MLHCSSMEQAFERKERVRVVVVDHLELVRACIRSLLERERDIEVVAEAASGKEAVELCWRLQPDVAVVGNGPGPRAGTEAVRQLTRDTSTRVLALTTEVSEASEMCALFAGAAGAVAKAGPVQELITAVRRVAANGRYVAKTSVETLVRCLSQPRAAGPDGMLSERERQVLVGLAAGKTTREVADALRLSPKTAEAHRHRILGKLGLRNNSDMTRYAIGRGLIALD